MKRALLPLALLAGLIAACAVFRPIGEPPMHRVSTDWARPLYALETFAYGPVEAGSPAFVKGPMTPPGGLLVVPSNDRFVRGVAAATGEVLWVTETRGPVRARPTAVGDDVIVGSLDGRVYRLQQRNGKKVWVSAHPVKGGVVAAAAVADGRVFVTSIDNRITALSLETGARLWDKKRPHPGEFTISGQAGVAVMDDAVVTGFSDGTLVAFAASDGAMVWKTDLKTDKTEFIDVDTTPQVVGEVIVTGCYAVGLFGLTVEQGEVRWLVHGEGYDTPAEHAGMLYVPQASGRLLAVDAATGDVRWVTRFKDAAPRTPAVSHRYVLVPLGDTLAVIDRDTGRVAERVYDTYGFSATPELAWGTLYAQANSGTLYALGIY